MFEFVRGAIRISIRRIKGLVETVFDDDKCRQSDNSDNVMEENLTVVDDDKCRKSDDINNVEEKNPTGVVDDKYRKLDDIDSDPELEVVIVYVNFRKYPLKRTYDYAFSEEDVQEAVQSVVKKIKLDCAKKAAAVLLKHNVGQSIICESLGIDATVLKSLEEMKEKSESNCNEERATIDAESNQSVLKEKSEDTKKNKDVKDIKNCYVRLERLKIKQKKKYKRIVLGKI